MKLERAFDDVVPKFVHHVLEPMTQAGIDLNKSFPDLTIYLGLQPEFELEEMKKGGFWASNYDRPHYTEHEGWHYCVVKQLYWKQAPVSAVMDTVAHELGHYIHTTYLGDEKTEEGMKRWVEWSKYSGKNLDFKKRFINGYPKIQSYEDFANDFAFHITHKSRFKNSYYHILLQHGKADRL